MSTHTIRIAGGIYDRNQPGWEPNPEHASRGTYLAETLYSIDVDGAPVIAVVAHAKNLTEVIHVASGLAIPAGMPGTSAAPGLHSNSLTKFRLKTAAKKYMLAVHEAGLLPYDRLPTHEELLALKAWLDETYDVSAQVASHRR